MKTSTYCSTSRQTSLNEELPLTLNCNVSQREAQLSQRDHATFLVIEYFAKSLKFTQGHSK